MEAGGKDTEEETLQTAFKKLRVDAESVPVAVSVSETLAPGGAKPKLSCPKDNWHGCTRKTSRGASRTQRRRRSKSPILHPPKFTYCSTSASAALSPPGVCLKHQRLAVPEPVEPHPAADGSSAAVPAQKELSSSGTAGNISPVVFGSAAGYDAHVGPENAGVSPGPGVGSSGDSVSSGENALEKSVCDRTDFRALSKLHSSSAAEGPHVPCSCAEPAEGPDEGTRAAAAVECPCRSRHQGWNGVEVYSFTGLRHVISECESGLPSHGDAARTVAASAAPAPASTALTSGSPRSCSEQARAYVDDITIEDLSGYMEYYLYIPKKMSHMAEMMYT